MYFLRRYHLFALLWLVAALPAWGQIPQQAYLYRRQLVREARVQWGMTAPIPRLAAQIHQESGWREGARSGAGALGLAQFMPGTAEWISRIYPADLGENQPLDARWAIRALVTYDRWLWDRLDAFRLGDDRWGAALASYNGGLGHIQREQRMAEGCDNSRYFCCVQSQCRRADWACRENTQYPARILFILEPRYEKAGW